MIKPLIALSAILIFSAPTASIAQERVRLSKGLQRNIGGTITSPYLGRPIPVNDRTLEFAQKSSLSEFSSSSQMVYLSNRYHQTLANENINAKVRNKQLAEIAALMDQHERGGSRGFSLGEECYGMVAHGTILEEEPRLDFVWSTVFDGRITIPRERGGSVNVGDCLSQKHVFLVSANQAIKNVEAFVAYDNETSEAKFVLFDWSIPNWALVIDYDDLADYITLFTSTGIYPVIYVHNATGDFGEGEWRNEVYLLNWTSSEFDLIYQRAYSATLAEQRGTGGKGLAFIETRRNWNDKNRSSQYLGFFEIYFGSGIVDATGDTPNEDRQWIWNIPNASNSHIRRDGFYSVGDLLGFTEFTSETIPNRQFVVN